MKICKILLLLVVALTVSNSYAQTRDDIAGKMNEGGKAINAKDYDTAIKHFTEAAGMLETTEDADAIMELQERLYSDLGMSYRAKGMGLAHGKKFDEALPIFTKSVENYKLAGNIMMQRDVERFISACYTQLVGVKSKAKKYNEAIEVCKEGLKLNANDTKLMILLAQCYDMAGNEKESIATYDKVIALAKRLPRLRNDGEKAKELVVNAQIKAAATLSEKGNKNGAIAKIKFAETYDPKSPILANTKLNIYSRAKDYKAVIANAPAALKLQTNAVGRSEVNYFLGAAYTALNNKPEAIKYYKLVTTGKYLQPSKSQITELNAAIKAENEANK